MLSKSSRYTDSRRHVNATFLRMRQNIDISVDSLTKKERSLRMLQMEQEEQIEQLVKRERRLNSYAETLLDSRKKLKQKGYAWDKRKEEFDIFYEDETRVLNRQLRDIEISDGVNSKRWATLQRDRMATEQQIDILTRKTASLADMFDEYQSTIQSYSADESTSLIFDSQDEIRSLKHEMRALSDRSSRIRSQLSMYEKELENIHDTSNSLNVKIQITKEEMSNIISDREKFIQRMQYQIQQATLNFGQMKRKQLHKTEKKSARLGRIEHLAAKIARVKQDDDNCRCEIQRLTSALIAAETEMRSAKQSLRDVKLQTDDLREAMAVQKEKGSGAARKLVSLKSELSRLSTERSQMVYDLEKAQSTADAQRRQLVHDERDFEEFLQIAESTRTELSRWSELDAELSHAQSRDIAKDLHSIDVSEQKTEMMEAIKRLRSELQAEQSELEILKHDVVDAETTVKKKAEERRRIEAKVKELLTITMSMYSPTGSSPQGLQTSRTIEYEIQGRSEARNNQLIALQKSTDRLALTIKEKREKLKHRKDKATRQKILLNHRIKLSQEFETKTGITEEKQLGMNSIQDFKRLLKDEVLTWTHATRSEDKTSVLNRWESKVNMLFDDLDTYYLR